jgi:hypothetical protein
MTKRRKRRLLAAVILTSILMCALLLHYEIQTRTRYCGQCGIIRSERLRSLGGVVFWHRTRISKNELHDWLVDRQGSCAGHLWLPYFGGSRSGSLACFLIPGSHRIPGVGGIMLGHGRVPPYGCAAGLFPLAQIALDDERLEEYARCFLMHDLTHLSTEDGIQDIQLSVQRKTAEVLLAGMDCTEDGSPSPEFLQRTAEWWDTEIRPDIQKCQAR